MNVSYDELKLGSILDMYLRGRDQFGSHLTINKHSLGNMIGIFLMYTYSSMTHEAVIHMYTTLESPVQNNKYNEFYSFLNLNFVFLIV